MLIETGESATTRPITSAHRFGILLILALAFCIRASFVFSWYDPYGVHHGDEVFLPYEAVAMWEGVTPRELGWPGSTVRVLLSAAYGVAMVIEKPAAFLFPDAGPLGIMNAVAEWSGRRLDDPHILMVIGRWLLVLIGVLQVGVACWAGGRWGGTRVGLAAAFLSAVAPIAVSHSQYILADMLGVLFLTWLVGLWASGGPATTGLAVGTGVLVGLAAASKFHFAIWIVPAVAAVWLSTRRRDADDRKTAITRVAYCLLASAGVVLFFVPWLWSNPVLMLKEFQGVVLSKVAGSETIGPARALWNLVSISDNFGLVVNAGLLPGLVLFAMRQGGRSIPVYVGLALGALAIAFTSRLYSRYALLVLPAVVLIAAIGIVAVIDRARGHARVVVACALLVLIVVSGWQLWTSQAYVGKADSYARAYAWLMRNMKPGDRIAVDAEFPQHLPRTREQLTAMVSEVSNPDAYAKKMASNGFQGAVDSQPMRLAVLNDEFYVAYWAQRELAGDTSRGFEITMYADAPQYNSILTREAVAQFVEGLTDSEKGFDLLLLNRPIELPVKPDAVFTGNPGRTISAYVRKPLLSDAARR